MGDFYVLGGKGLEKPQRYNIEVGKAYYFGASSDPDVILITRKDDKYIYYVKISSNRHELAYIETRDQSVFIEDMVSRAMQTKQQQNDVYKASPFYHPSNVDHVLEDNDPCDYDYPSDYMTFEENQNYQQEIAKNYKPPKYIDTVEVAKIIRGELKTNFPGVKFSVKSDRYAGGSSIRVNWYDGPTTKEVESIVGHYHGASFDGMTDSTNFHNSEYKGETVHFSNHYLFCERKYTVAALEEVAKYILDKYGWIVPVIESEYEPYFDHDSYDYSDGSRINTELYEYSFYKREDPTPEVEDQTEETDRPAPIEYSPDVTVSDYKGHPVINLPMGDNSFTFGVNKAKAILAYLRDIEKFIEENS
jgi:hypothetical protein